MASCSLKAYGLKWQWGAGDAKAIISPSCTPAGKRRVLSRNKGREGGQEWQEVSDCHTASQHTCTDCWIYYRVGFQTSISLKVLRAEIMSVLLFSLSFCVIYRCSYKWKWRTHCVRSRLVAIMDTVYKIQVSLNRLFLTFNHISCFFFLYSQILTGTTCAASTRSNQTPWCCNIVIIHIRFMCTFVQKPQWPLKSLLLLYKCVDKKALTLPFYCKLLLHIWCK